MAYASKTKSGLWIGRYRDPQGKLHNLPARKSKREAVQLAQQEEAKIRGGIWVDPEAGRITVDEYWRRWSVTRRGEINTKSTRRYVYGAPGSIEDVFGERPLKSLRHGDIQGWVDQMEADGVGAATIHKRFGVLRTMLAAKRGSSALRDRLIDHNPCEYVALPKLVMPTVQVYSPDEYEQLVMAMPEEWRAIPALAGDTGLRFGELMGIQLEDFTLNYRSVRIVRTVVECTKQESGNGTRFRYKHSPKTDHPRTIALTEESQKIVRALIAAHGLGPGDRLFPMLDRKGRVRRTAAWPEGLPICRTFYRSVWKKATEDAGLRYLRPHSSRAAHISWLLAGGADLASVMQQVGHTQFATTKRYTGAMADADRRLLDALAETKSRYRSIALATTESSK